MTKLNNKKDVLGLYEDPINADAFSEFCGQNQLSINQICETRIIINEYLKILEKFNFETKKYKISDLDISVRTENCLFNMLSYGFLNTKRTIYDVAIHIFKNNERGTAGKFLLKQNNLGKRSFDEIINQLKVLNLYPEFMDIANYGKKK